MNSQIIDLSNPLWFEILETLQHDIYHLPEYIYLEARRTNTKPEGILICEDEKIFFFPYLLRNCDELFDTNTAKEESFDVISPYGYPGILLSEAARTPEFLNIAIEQLKSVLSARNVCSAFFRLHPILNQDLNDILPTDICKVNGETVSVNLILSEEEIWHQTRADHRNHINRFKRAGYQAKTVLFEEYLQEFISIYEETMDRVKAKEMYYFDYEYFVSLKRNKNIHLCIVELENEVACAGIFTECCGIVQYHLSGTRNKFLKQAPTKLMLDYMRFWAKKRGNKVLHLGGGLGSTKDSLYEFKAGFSKQRHNFLTVRLITDETKYYSLVDLQAKALNTEPEKLLNANYFPAYRCSNI